MWNEYLNSHRGLAQCNYTINFTLFLSVLHEPVLFYINIYI
jgi:hypothetical protein